MLIYNPDKSGFLSDVQTVVTLGSVGYGYGYTTGGYGYPTVDGQLKAEIEALIQIANSDRQTYAAQENAYYGYMNKRAYLLTVRPIIQQIASDQLLQRNNPNLVNRAVSLLARINQFIG